MEKNLHQQQRVSSAYKLRAALKPKYFQIDKSQKFTLVKINIIRMLLSMLVWAHHQVQWSKKAQPLPLIEYAKRIADLWISFTCIIIGSFLLHIDLISVLCC